MPASAYRCTDDSSALQSRYRTGSVIIRFYCSSSKHDARQPDWRRKEERGEKRELDRETVMKTEFRKIEGKHRRGERNEGRECHTSHLIEREENSNSVEI